VSIAYFLYSHWLGDSNFSAQFTVKNVDCFSDIFTEKNGEIFKPFSPLFNFLSNFSPQTGKVVKKLWKFYHFFTEKYLKNNRYFSL
jgi:hypothetical protein